MAYTKSWLELEKQMGGRFVMRGAPEELKANYDPMAAMLFPQLPPPSNAVEIKDGEVEGIKCRVYTPVDASKEGPLPVAIWTHGGGFITGDINTDDHLCRVVAEQAPSIIVNARQNAASIGGHANKFYTIGGSAGGALSLQVANRIVQDPSKRDAIKGVAAIVPITVHWDNVPAEYQSMYKSYEENKEDVPIIDKKSMEMVFVHAAADPKDGDMFTALATQNHKNFPPVYFVSCEKDPLRDDAYVMEAALKKTGVPTKHDHYKGLPHYFWVFPSLPEGQQFVENLIEGVKWLISQM